MNIKSLKTKCANVPESLHKAALLLSSGNVKSDANKKCFSPGGGGGDGGGGARL